MKGYLCVFFLWIVFFAGLYTSLLAQPFYSKRITLDEGLPSKTIYDLCVSHESGFLYLATDRGIFTYNGSDFKKIQLENPLTNSVTDIHISEEGIIWCRNFSNQLFYSKKPYSADSMYVFDIQSIIELPPLFVKFSFLNNTLWLCMPQKIIAIDITTKKIVFQYDAPKGKAFETLFIHQNKIWWTTEESFLVYVFDGKKVKTIPLKEDAEQILRFAALDKMYAVGNRQNKGILYEFEKESYKTIPIKNWIQGTYTNTIVAEKGLLWICTNSGLWLLNENYEGKQLFSQMRISDICSDYQGNFWISTLDEGLICMPSLDAKLLDFPPQKTFEPFTKLFHQKGKILAANPKGELFTYDTKDKKFTGFYETLVNNQPEFIAINPYNNLIYSSFGIFKEGNPKPIFDSWYTRSMAFSPSGYLFGAAYRTLVTTNFSFTKVPTFYKNFPLSEITSKENTQIATLDSYRAKAVFYDTLHHRIWVTTVDNLLVYDTLGNKKELLDAHQKPITGAKIIQDKEGKIWIGTTNNGLYVFQDTILMNHITTKNGLPNQGFRQFDTEENDIFALLESQIWKVNIQNYAVSQVKELDQLGFTYVSSFAVSDSLFWLCVPNGIAFFDKSISKKETALPKFWVDKISLADSTLFVGKKISVEYDQNQLQIALQPLLFINTSFQFEYRLLRNDILSEWKKMPIGTTSFNFEALEHGKYQLELRLFHLSNATFSELQTFHFEIKKPFWLTWWAFLIETIFVVGLIGISVQGIKKRIQKKQQLKERLLISQMTALRSQMNPHFLYNVLSSLQGLIYSDKINEASDYVSQFSQHLRSSLQFSTELEIPIEEEIKGIETYLSLEKLRFGDDFIYEVIKSETIYENFLIPSMIVQPYIENAVKHGLLHKKGNKNLTVSFDKRENLLHITIEDNGIGREASAMLNAKRKDKPSSFATKAIDERITLLNFQRKQSHDKSILLEIEDKYEQKNNQKIATGTKITLFIPLL